MLTRICTIFSIVFFATQMFAAAFTNLFTNVLESSYCEADIKPSADGKILLRITDGTNTVDNAVNGNGSKLSFRRYRNRCDIFIDGVQALSVADKWNTPVSVLLDEAAFNPESEEYRQELGAFSFSDSFMVAEGDTNALRDWEKLSGEWSLHSVTGRTAHANDGQTLTRFPEPANSPNFYSLTGSGSCAVIAAGELFYSHYAVRAALQHSSGTNGIAFLMNDAPSFYLFAVETDPADGKLIFTLRDSCVPGESSGKVLKAVKTDLYQSQWYMLEARTTEDEILCLVDDIEIIRHHCKLPAGGMFGLFTDTAGTTRFDDVSAETYAGLNTSNPKEADNAEFHGTFNGARFFGCANDPAAEISVPLTLDKEGDTLSLSIGQKSKTSLAPAFSASATKTKGAVRFSLLKFNTASNILEEVDSFSLPCDGNNYKADSFALDGRDGHFAAVRLNGTTIMLSGADTPPTGAAGFQAASKDNSALIPRITREKSKFTDQFEKNKLYVTDPYMRHWASTAGQWLTYTNNTAWYKDDVLKHVTLEMPLIDNLELHLAVPDDSEEGALRITTGTGALEIARRNENGEYPALCKWTYPSAQINQNDGTIATNTPATFRLDGHRFAFLSPTGVVFQCDVNFPYTGRKMFFKKVPQKYPGNIIVTRSPVIDCLFSESLHDWSVNGGVWEIVNRFQCLPKWSHMDGENADSLAALWSKYEFSGDFSMTFIAGIRHRWYNRMGDMNLTLMNNATSPSDGYTLSVTGWDPDESQRWSKLYRNGKEIAASDKYTVPRRRLGNVRRIYEPLLASGRDVHGAWYAIRLRRNGKKLTFLFDNEKVFDVEDDAPLSSGSFGIWTYLNSMVVARVRLAADEIRPKPFPFKELALADYSAPRHDADQQPLPAPLTFNGLPVDLIRPEFWYSADDVSMPSISFSNEDGEPVMTVTSTHGSGSFLAAPTEKIAAVSGTFLAGWSFEVARSENAQFNFEYSYSSSNGAKPNHFTHVLTGYAGEKGKRIISGQSQPPQATAAGKKKVWTPVTVWLPATGYSPADYVAKIEGFGNLEHSDIQKGLHGNAPGEWFAIRRMRPVYRDVPVPENKSENKAAFDESISSALAAGKGGIVNSFAVPEKISPTHSVIQWVQIPPDSPGLIAEFSPDPEFMIKVKSTLPWPNPMITTSNVTVNGVSIQHAHIRDNELRIPLPRPFCPTSAPAVKVSFQTVSGRPFTQMLMPSVFTEAGQKLPPVITSVRFPNTPYARYESFESRTNNMVEFSENQQRKEVTPDLCLGDPEQGAFMRIANKGDGGRRLGAILERRFNLPRCPWMQFRYRGDEMALTSLFIPEHRYYAFSSLTPSSGVLGKATLDNRWHTALCRLSNTEIKAVLSKFVLAPQIQAVITTSTRVDGRGENQTGLYSCLDIDEIAFAPAVNKQTSGLLGFRAQFDAPSGITAAQYAVVSGAVPFDSRTDEELKAVTWHDFDPASTNTVLPVLDGLPDGVYHLVIRGLSGETATVRPADIPFEIDNTPPSVTVSRGSSPLLENRQGLNITVDGGNGTHPDLSVAKILSDGQPCPISSTLNAVGATTLDNKLNFAINWPLVMRDQIQASTNGATVTLTISNICDAACNYCQPVNEAFKIDYASDKTPPAITIDGSTYKVLYGQPRMSASTPFFTSFGEHLIPKYVEAKDGQPAHLSLSVKNEANAQSGGKVLATVSLTPWGNRQPINWISTTNRWLMLRVRIPGNVTPPAAGTEAFKLRFLVEKTPDNSRYAAKSNLYTLSVPVTNAPAAPLYGSFGFESNKWNDIAIDVATALKNIIGTEKEVKILRFYLDMPAKPGYGLDISQACILSNWPEKQNINLNAYDPSGIKGVFIDGKFSHEGWRIVPANITPPDSKKFFYDLTVRDRADNVSPAMTFPFPPPAPDGK